MTHLAENEYAALYVPGAVHPSHPPALHRGRPVPVDAGERRGPAHRGVHEARARERRRAPGLDGDDPGLAAVAARAGGLHAGFVPAVGARRGTFLEYLAFVERYAPDPVTADIARRARVDEARHVAFGVEHARHSLGADPDRAGELRAAVERRAAYLADASGQSPHVEEALVDPRRRRHHAEQDPRRRPRPCASSMTRCTAAVSHG